MKPRTIKIIKFWIKMMKTSPKECIFNIEWKYLTQVNLYFFLIKQIDIKPNMLIYEIYKNHWHVCYINKNVLCSIENDCK